MTDEQTPKIDKSLFESLLANYWSVTIYVFKHPDVKLPDMVKPKKWAKGWGPEGKVDEIPICLEYGLNMPTPIVDLRITDDGVSAILSFNHTPHETYVPWAAVGYISCGPPNPKVRNRPKLGLVP